MTKRIERPHRKGHDDPSGISRLHAVSQSPLPLDAPEEPTSTPPMLTLVGGADITPTALEPVSTLGT